MVDLTKTLDLIPLIGNKVGPPDAHWGRDWSGCGITIADSLVGGEDESPWTFPVHEKNINSALVPNKVQGMYYLKK